MAKKKERETSPGAMWGAALLCAAVAAAAMYFVAFNADVADPRVKLKAKEPPTQAKADVAQAKVDVTQAKADVSPAKTEAVPASADLEQAETDVAKASAEVVPAKTDVEQANADAEQGKADVAPARAETFEDPPMPLEEHHPDASQVVQLSSRPRAFFFPNFLSTQECDYIVNYSRPRVVRSKVGAGTVDDIRTSSGTAFDKWTNPVIRRIEERVAAWTHIPVDYQEPMQVLKYVDGEKYGAHYDYYEEHANLTGGPRYCTVLMYLSNVEYGGETVFPNSEQDPKVKDDSWSDCGKQGIAVKPQRGSALLFFNMKPDGSFDASSLHSGCPVLKGEKWSATKWIHTGNFGAPFWDPGVCQDDHEQCALWAANGECENNAKFMKGEGKTELGYCRKSCQVCS